MLHILSCLDDFFLLCFAYTEKIYNLNLNLIISKLAVKPDQAGRSIVSRIL